MNFNLDDFNIDNISNSSGPKLPTKSNLLPSIPPKSSGLTINDDDLFGLDMIMNKSKAKKSPSPTNSLGGGTKSPPPHISSARSTPPNLSPINKVGSDNDSSFNLDFSSPSKPSSTSFSIPGLSKPLMTGPSLPKIPGLSSTTSVNKIDDLDKEIKSLSSSLDDDLKTVNDMKNSMSGPKIPSFANSQPVNIPGLSTPLPTVQDSILHLSYEEIQKRKLDLICKFDRLRSKGVKIMKQYNMSSDYEEMKNEYDTIMKNKRLNDSVKFQRRLFVTLASGLETFSESSLNPFDVRLTELGSIINDDIDSYDDIFEELHIKYVGEDGNYPPELRLVMKLGTSVAWCIYQNKMMENSNVPDFNRIMKENPELSAQFKRASQNAYNKMNPGQTSFSSNNMDGPPIYDAGTSNDNVPNIDDILNSL